MFTEPAASTEAENFPAMAASDGSSDGYDTVCDGDGGDECGGRCRRRPPPSTTPWNSWAALPSQSVVAGAVAASDDDDDDDDEEEEGDDSDEDEDEYEEDVEEAADEDADNNNDDDDDSRELNGAIRCAIGQLMEAQEAVARLWQGQSFPGASENGNRSSSTSIRSNSNSGGGGVSSSGSSCVIKGDLQLSLVDHVNQSACDSAGEDFRNFCSGHAREEEEEEEVTAEATVDESANEAPPASPGPEWTPTPEPSAERSPTDEREGAEATAEAAGLRRRRQQRQQWQPLQPPTTCEEDVIGQRLNSCLQLLQGGPYQECDQCVKTLSSCDQNQLASRELLDRLHNLETLLLYLQIRYRSQMSCGKLKLLCRLKKTIGCMHGFLLRRQAEQTMSQVARLHRRLDRTGDFRRHWRPVPPGGEKFRFVADPLDCVPRVEAEDEWLRAFLPEPERPSLGHILADSDPVIAEQLGKRMAFSKRRGRSTRLHNLFTRDSYEDMMRRFQFAFNA